MITEIILGVAPLLIYLWTLLKRAVNAVWPGKTSITKHGQIPSTSQPPTFTAEDIHLIRLRFLNGRVSAKVLQFVFKRDTWNRPHGTSLCDFFESRGILISKFRKGLNTEQRARIDTDPDGDTFDVTLLCRCLRSGGSHVLASEFDAKWKEEDKGTLESLITAIKNRRNVISHEEPVYNSRQFLKKTEELRRILTDTLNLVGNEYNVPLVIVQHEITELDSEVNKYLHDDLMPKDFEEYKKQLLFQAQQEYVNEDGKNEVKEQYDERDETIVTPLNHMNINFPVEEVFTQMKLMKESENEEGDEVTYENLLEDRNQTKSNPIILIVGSAGAGKTTLIKKTLSEWKSKDPSNIKELDNYDLVLHSQCRHPKIQSYIDVLRSLMPNTSKSFKGDDLVYVTLAQKVFIILDGLDELNSSSERLFQEILHLKKEHHGITVMVTTRPEKLEYFHRSVSSLQLQVKHIVLLGIPSKRWTEFVSKYHSEMEKINPDIPFLFGLLDYLERTRHRLEEVWRLPYNLALLVVLWVHNSALVNSITTSIELYWQFHLLNQLKIKERLLRQRSKSYLCEFTLKKKIQNFMSSLGNEALTGLIHDQITILEDSYERLEEVCVKNDLPPDEMLGAFLKKVITKTLFGFEITYSLPHKGLQEFLAALHFLKEIENAVKFERSAMKSPDVLKTSSTSPVEGSTIVRDLLKKLHGPVPLDIEKFQNLFMILIGLSHLQNNKMGDDITEEILKLLQESGIKKRSDWLRILDSVKCNEFVATFISQQDRILEGSILINSSNIFAYLSLLKAFQSPVSGITNVNVKLGVTGAVHGIDELIILADFHHLRMKSILITDDTAEKYTTVLANPPPSLNPQEVEIQIQIMEEISATSELLDQINSGMFQVKDLSIHQDLKKGTHDSTQMDAINHIFNRCQVVTYAGAVNSQTSLPKSLQKLLVNAADAGAYNALRQFMESNPKLKRLGLIVRHDIDYSLLSPLHYPEGEYFIYLYITDVVTDSDINSAGQIAKQLRPPKGRKYTILVFPRASLSYKQIAELLHEMRGVEVMRSIIFPKVCQPTTVEERSQLQNLSVVILGCKIGITWGNSIMCDIDDW